MHTSSKIATLILVSTLIMASHCGGNDFTPKYFELGGGEGGQPSETPPPTKPQEEGAKVVVFRLIDTDAGEKELPIPSGNILEVTPPVFISRDETEVGSKFQASARFKIVNNGSTPLNISIPPQKGAFYISPQGALVTTIPAGKSIIIEVTFRPSMGIVDKGGEVVEELNIGGETFKLKGTALDPEGMIEVNVLNEDGSIEVQDTPSINVGEVGLTPQFAREFFKCGRIVCSGEERVTNCGPCVNPILEDCSLLVVNKEGVPLDEVDKDCKRTAKDRTPKGVQDTSKGEGIQRKVIELLNRGTEPILIKSIEIRDIDSSASKGEFSIVAGSISMGGTFEEAKEGMEGEKGAGGVKLPVTLPPYDPKTSPVKLYIVVLYHPTDTIGRRGEEAAGGESVKDEALFIISYDDKMLRVPLTGTTTIKSVPPLEVYIKTSTGTKQIVNGDVYPLKGVTSETTDIAVPLFVKLADSAPNGFVITNVSVSGTAFEWLDTEEKIKAKPEDVRCTIPILDANGSEIGIIKDPKPADLASGGLKLEPGKYTLETMPLLGCINFTRDPAKSNERVFEGKIDIKARGSEDNGGGETDFSFSILAVINPLKGKMVIRLTQTMAGLMSPQFPSINSVPSSDMMDLLIKEGRASESDRKVFLMSMILDPFDEETIYNLDGSIASTPGDGITAVFRPIDTRPLPVVYDDPSLSSFTSLIHDETLPEGIKGIFTGYPNLPEGFRTSGLRIFTGSLSYPGPLVDPLKKPSAPSQCEEIDPCTIEGQRRLAEGPRDPSYKGVCAYFYITAGDSGSKAFHSPNEVPPGTRRPMCEDRTRPYELEPIKGRYYLNGRMEFENMDILFQGPTYFHNPKGPLGPVPPLDELFTLTFTTELILPPQETDGVNRIPDKKINISKGEYKINLNDPTVGLPELCKNNVKNEIIGGKRYSTWRYIAPLLKKDKEGKIPAGCPEEDNDFTGGVAYIGGRRLDQATGHVTFVALAKFSSNDNLTFAFKDLPIFLVLNGWFCDPYGSEEMMEGKHCYDKEFNWRDAESQFSIIGGGK